MLLHITGKFTMGKLNHLPCRKFSFLTGPYCQFRCVGQGMPEYCTPGITGCTYLI
jgi:hypothetical protein